MYYKLKGHIRKSVKHFEQYVAGVESLRRGDLSADNRQALFEQWVPGYIELSQLYLTQPRSFEAFRLAEMSKARTLLESLAAKLAAQQSGLTAKEQQQLQDNEARLAVLNDRIAKASEDNRLEEQIVLETEKNQLVNQFNQFHRELMAKYPKYAQLSEVQIIGAKEGAKYLPADAVLISYLVAKNKVNENQVLAFTLQHDGRLTAHDLGKIPNLKENVEDYQRQLSLLGRGRPIVRGNQIKKDRETLSRQLGKYLLEPIKPLIKDNSHWIISPDGPLALIPFETLRLDGEEQPVIAQHQISYVQSLSVLKLLQERDKAYKALKERGTLLAMGAPLYEQKIAPNSPLLNGRTSPLEKEGNFPLEKGETSPVPKAQTPAAETVTPSTVDFNIARRLVRDRYDPQRYGRAFRQLGLIWRNLPGALAELEQLEALFKETQPAIYKQEKATEAQLQTLNQQGELANYRYLVFSAHGYLSPQVSALSSIVLGQLNNPPGIDGYVTAGEWPSYDLKSDLMVLSACETGRGEVVGGEGVMGLPYAFYVAGNKNTLLTLWRISDKVTTEFVTRFFKKLKDGMEQLEALTATKREFIKKGGDTSSPAYWAAFVLYGV
jgi:CHAT domain-containing protein